MITKQHVNFGFSHETIVPVGILTHAMYSRRRDDLRFDPQEAIRILKHYNVAAHYVNTRHDGVIELVPPTLKAWHAGLSEFRGYKGLNGHFIGVEWIGDEETDFTDEQYENGAELYVGLMKDYDIPSYNITMHQIVSGPSVRSDWKWDPGERFDWVRFGMMIGDIK